MKKIIFKISILSLTLLPLITVFSCGQINESNEKINTKYENYFKSLKKDHKNLILINSKGLDIKLNSNNINYIVKTKKSLLTEDIEGIKKKWKSFKSIPNIFLEETNFFWSDSLRDFKKSTFLVNSKKIKNVVLINSSIEWGQNFYNLNPHSTKIIFQNNSQILIKGWKHSKNWKEIMEKAWIKEDWVKKWTIKEKNPTILVYTQTKDQEDFLPKNKLFLEYNKYYQTFMNLVNRNDYIENHTKVFISNYNFLKSLNKKNTSSEIIITQENPYEEVIKKFKKFNNTKEVLDNYFF